MTEEKVESLSDYAWYRKGKAAILEMIAKKEVKENKPERKLDFKVNDFDENDHPMYRPKPQPPKIIYVFEPDFEIKEVSDSFWE